MKQSPTKTIIFLILFAALIIGFYKSASGIFTPPQTKPEPIVDEKVYEYYILIDEKTNDILGHVSTVKVTTGDEYVSSNNKRYVVTRVEENRAYMRDFGAADSGNEKGDFKDKTN